MHRLITLIRILVSSFLLPTSILQAEVVYPDNVGLIHVTEFGAIPDDGKDDTKAIQDAIRSSYHVQENIKHDIDGLVHERQPLDKKSLRTLYFPNGTYNIHDTLEWTDENGDYRAFLVLQGESQEGVIIKLKDRTFEDKKSPQAMIYTANATKDGQGNIGFSNYIQDMTLDTGEGNIGAYGIDYVGNNVCAIRRVTIRSSDGKGQAGIYLGRKYPGPWMMKDVTIEGFDFGLDFGQQTNYNTTIQGLTLRKQNIAAIQSNCHATSIRNLHSENKVPVLLASNENGRSLACIIDSTFTGGSEDNYAIDFTGGLYLRNIKISGYKQQPLFNRTTNKAEGSRDINEYISHDPVTAFNAPPTSLNLPIEEIPESPDNNLDQWVIVQPTKASGADAIQAGIDQANAEGKHTVFLASGVYTIDKTVVINGSVERIFGFGSNLIWAPEDLENSTGFVVKDRTAPHLFFEHVSYNHYPEAKRFVWIRDHSEEPIIFRDITQWGDSTIPYVNTKPKKVFIENCSLSRFTLKNTQTWAWQFDTEMNQGIKVINDGGDLWILGIKTEWANTNIKNINGGRVEILGGLFYPPYGSNTKENTTPGIENIDSELSATFCYSGDQNEIYVRNIRNGKEDNFTFTFASENNYPRWGKVIPLYSSHSYPESPEKDEEYTKCD